MKEYTTEFLRNIALVSHGGAGKTMLAEAFLHLTGATTRLGSVEDGTTVSDYDEEEIRSVGPDRIRFLRCIRTRKA